MFFVYFVFSNDLVDESSEDGDRLALVGGVKYNGGEVGRGRKNQVFAFVASKWLALFESESNGTVAFGHGINPCDF